MAVKKISQSAVLSFVRSAMTPSNRLHVIARDGRWIVKRDGAERAMGIYRTKNKAVSIARAQLRAGKVNYALVHDLEGKIAQKIS
jgi:hypothetical protein